MMAPVLERYARPIPPEGGGDDLPVELFQPTPPRLQVSFKGWLPPRFVHPPKSTTADSFGSKAIPPSSLAGGEAPTCAVMFVQVPFTKLQVSDSGTSG